MELRDYLRIMRRRWRIIVACLLTAVAVAALVTFTMTPIYASSARLFVSTTPSDTGEAYQGSLFASQRVTSYADLVDGREMLTRVIDELDLEIQPDELAEKIDATVVPETVILEITAEDPDPATAQALAQTSAEELVTFVDDLETPPGQTQAPIKASVVDSAPRPESPVSPQPIRNLGLAAVLGLLLGLGLAVLREMLDTSVKSAEDVLVSADAPVMGHITFDSSAVKTPLITSLGSHAPRVESSRILRTNMQFVDVDHNSKAFVVSSSVPREGKTTTATNLAIALAQAGQKVLLMDGDLRRPQVASILGIEPAVGLTTVLVGSMPLADAVQKHSVPNLWVLTSGATPPNPSELIQSHAMAEVLTQARQDYDIIVIDAPPLLPVTDAALLARQADGALLVVRHGSTTRDQLAMAAERLGAVEAKTLGAVLNMVPTKGAGGYGYGYSYGYGYAPEPAESGRRKRLKPEEGPAGG